MQAGSRADEQSGGGEAEEGEGVGGGTQHGAASGDRLGESREYRGDICVCVCITDSFCCTVETNATL